MRGFQALTYPSSVLLRHAREIILCFIISLAGASSQAALIDKAMGLYASGNPAEARRLAQAVLSENSTDARALLIMAQTETGGKAAQSWAEQAVAAAGNQSPADEAILLLIELHASTKGHGAILERADQYFRTFDRRAALADAVRWWAAVANLALGRTAAADSILQGAADHPASSLWNQRLRLLHANSCTETERATRMYKKLLQAPDPYIVNQALLGLMDVHQQRGEVDRVVLYRNLLNEKFPNTALVFPGISAEDIPPTTSRSGDAEILADIVYTVQLGAFSDKANAVKLRDAHTRGRRPVHFFSREIAGKTYWVVQVGSFTSLDEAKRALEQLQREDNATYRVVVR